jgi:SAM-dependent methyltransferase
MDQRGHWETVYRTKAETDVSWFQESPKVSLDLIDMLGIAPQTGVIDVGGGASRLVDALLEKGFDAVTVLDISEPALAATRARLGKQADRVHWLAADATQWEPKETYGLWHDRAAFHFLTEAADRAAYANRVARAVAPGGHVIIATFAPDGPERCSGLPVQRHDAESIGAVLGGNFALVDTRRHDHQTPGGSVQRFQFSTFRRIA